MTDLTPAQREYLERLKRDMIEHASRNVIGPKRRVNLETMEDVGAAMGELAGTEDVQVTWHPDEPDTLYVRVTTMLPPDVGEIDNSFRLEDS